MVKFTGGPLDGKELPFPGPASCLLGKSGAKPGTIKWGEEALVGGKWVFFGDYTDPLSLVKPATTVSVRHALYKPAERKMDDDWGLERYEFTGEYFGPKTYPDDYNVKVK